MNRSKITTAILVTILTLTFSACGTGLSPTINRADVAGTAQAAALTMVAQTLVALPTGTLSPVSDTPVILADCFVTFHFAAWIDFDEDGRWDTSEPPLAGVKFSPPGRFAQVWGHPYLSEADGWLRIEVWSPGGCPAQEVTVTAVPPGSYEPTTPPSINLSLTSDDFSYEAQFGFRAVR